MFFLCLINQMTTFSDWLTEREVRKQVPFQELYIIGKELDKNAIAIRAGDVFPITYSLVANVRLCNVQILYSVIEEAEHDCVINNSTSTIITILVTFR